MSFGQCLFCFSNADAAKAFAKVYVRYLERESSREASPGLQALAAKCRRIQSRTEQIAITPQTLNEDIQKETKS